MSVLLLALLAAVRVEGVAVRPVDGRPGIVVTAHEPMGPVVVSRHGRTLRVRIPGARLSAAYTGPRFFVWRARVGRSAMPARALRLTQARDDVLLQFTVAPDVPFGVHQEGRTLRLAFAEAQRAPLTRGRSLLVAEAAPAPALPPEPALGPAPAPPSPAPGGAPAFAALRAAAEPLTVTAEEAGPRALLRIRGGAGLADARVRREGGEVIVTFDVGAEGVPPSPATVAPMDEVHVEKVATLAVVHVKVAPEVPFEVERGPRILTLTFGEEAALGKVAPPNPPPSGEGVDVHGLVTPEMYRGLFPASLGMGQDERGAAATSDLAREGLQVGPVHLRPTILTSYVAGDYTLLDSPDPVNDRYLQVEPRVSADMPLLGGELVAEYSLRLRYFSQFDEINTPSHFLNGGLEVPVGSRTTLRLRDHFSTGILEYTEVDPGQEYFFNLTRFRRNEIEAGALVMAGERAFLDGSVGVNEVDFDDPGGFFPYSSRNARLGAGLTFGDNLRAGLYYTYDRIPPPDTRTLVESESNSVGVAVEGDLGALTTGEIRLDYQSTDAPLAGAGGQSYQGLAGTLSLSRELSPSSRLTLQGRRATDLSAFEENAFYVSTGGRVLFSFGLPLSLSVNTGVGYQENHYRTAASVLGVPREDTLLGWTLGLSRPLGSFAYVRADYRRDQRRSNLPGFDLTTDGIMVQLGLGLFGTSVRR